MAKFGKNFRFFNLSRSDTALFCCIFFDSILFFIMLSSYFFYVFLRLSLFFTSRSMILPVQARRRTIHRVSNVPCGCRWAYHTHYAIVEPSPARTSTWFWFRRSIEKASLRDGRATKHGRSQISSHRRAVITYIEIISAPPSRKNKTHVD